MDTAAELQRNDSGVDAAPRKSRAACLHMEHG